MRVLFDYQIFFDQPYGGASRYVYELLRNSARLFEPVFAGRYADNEYSRQLGVFKNRSALPLIGKKRRFQLEMNKLYASLEFLRKSYDIFHPTHYGTYHLGTNKKPLVLTVHDMTYEVFPQYFSDPQSKAYIDMKRRNIESADQIIAISESTQRDILRFLPHIDPEKITVVHHGCSFSGVVSPVDKAVFPYILFTGQRGTFKNFPAFVEAVAPLLAKYGLKLICTGPDFSSAEREMLREKGIDGMAIHEYASEARLRELYAQALCFVFPSLYEGFGLPILEAFQMHCPALLSQTSSLPEIGGQAAVYFDPESIDDMRRKIESVILNPTKRAEMADRGFARSLEFSWKACAEGTTKVYRKAEGQE